MENIKKHFTPDAVGRVYGHQKINVMDASRYLWRAAMYKLTLADLASDPDPSFEAITGSKRSAVVSKLFANLQLWENEKDVCPPPKEAAKQVAELLAYLR